MSDLVPLAELEPRTFRHVQETGHTALRPSDVFGTHVGVECTTCGTHWIAEHPGGPSSLANNKELWEQYHLAFSRRALLKKTIEEALREPKPKTCWHRILELELV